MRQRLTVEQYLTEWLGAMAVRVTTGDLRPKTLYDYEKWVRLHLVPGIGRIKLARLSVAQVQDLLDSQRSNLSRRSIQMTRDILRNALNWHEGNGIVSRNVAGEVRVRRVSQEKVHPYNPQEAQTFIEAARGHRLGALFITAITCGLRQSELIGLRWNDLDLDLARLRVRTTLQQVRGEWVDGEPKSDASKRTLPLPALTVKALKAHRTQQWGERLMAGPVWDNQRDLVFCTHSGGPLGARNLTRDFHKLTKRAGLRTVTFHNLRHSTASLLVATNSQLTEIKELLGHSDIRLTSNTYTHLFDEAKRAAMDKLDDALSGRPTQEARA